MYEFKTLRKITQSNFKTLRRYVPVYVRGIIDLQQRLGPQTKAHHYTFSRCTKRQRWGGNGGCGDSLYLPPSPPSSPHPLTQPPEPPQPSHVAVPRPSSGPSAPPSSPARMNTVTMPPAR
ncbi:hypothetical protein E2C01_024392 [Portunus trituberculatus]|uniref:Uncharacterized protein n=1 Tax=Portunus trituberculatus TaxID=210409 RepID=A0A5B7EDP7_PORTR|nr:hypothetical protein [Portunus trituberculatus]